MLMTNMKSLPSDLMKLNYSIVKNHSVLNYAGSLLKLELFSLDSFPVLNSSYNFAKINNL